ncbi:MAG TPA: histidine kinase [Acidimicrobiia bacterium]|nr:histidine kinase [Acidimicrobiia bacterium]
MTRDDGAMAIAITALIAIVAVLTTAIAAMGVLYGARAQATNAADAGALAAAVATYPPAAQTSPLAAARAVAGENGAVVTSCRCPIDTGMRTRVVEVRTAVAVEVPVFGAITVRSASRAEFDPRLWLGR